MNALRWLFVVFLLTLSGVAFGREECHERCAPDEACVYGRCVHACSPGCRPGTTCGPSGECVPETVTLGQQTEAQICLEKGKESQEFDEAIFGDFGGFLFNGFQLGYEWGKADAFVLRGVLMNTGFSNYATESLNEFENFEFGFGASGGYRRYEAKWGNLRGFYYGGGGLYQAVQSVDTSDHPFARTTHFIGPYGEFGYRWVFGSLLFGFGPSLNLRIPVVSHFAPRAPGGCVEAGNCAAPDTVRFEGTLSVEVGFLR